MPGPFSGLSVKIIATIIFVILAVQVIIYLPSAANFRMSWLEDRLRVGIVAARVLDAVPDVLALPRELTDRLLNSAGATAIVYRREGQSQLLELEQAPMPRLAVTIDMRATDPLTTIGGVLDTLLMGGDRTIRIVGEGDADNSQNLVEVLMPEQPLRLELLIYSRNTFVISLIVALMTALVLYLFVSRILIDPIRRLSENMLGYRKAPENATLIITATPRRRDEIGILEQELAAMETEIFTLLRQRRHLADLGLAVSKINHDLRNTLTSAQLLSDQVATLDDPKVQRLAPRLVHSIDRAVGFAQSVLDYGRQSSTPPKPVPIDVRTLVDEAAFEAGLLGHGTVKLRNEVADGVIVRADPDQLARVFVNLMKNAREALETQGETNAAPTITASAVAGEQTVVISIADNGPGLPPRARDNLFVAFEGSARAGGTGLGLAIAREIAEAHGGSLAFIDRPKGTRFDITLPTG
ncbi:sensor histidine kinase [Devosia sp.]|jgi:signal transduction histidine kinase|uniref:sensor histidine kinase n=1 Tax=Devosia sp. TaxID=1871048 RepID=UPI0037C0930A